MFNNAFKPKDKTYFSGGGQRFGKRERYDSFFSKPEEELYFETDPYQAYNTFGFARGGHVCRGVGKRVDVSRSCLLLWA